jgi:uncharacterized protein YdeI (YjbR/CyaY-like superfamily)
MTEKQDLPMLPFASAADWESWLAENHATSQGLWIKIAKKGRGIPTVTHAEALDAALCYGWIDGQRDALDEDFFLQRFTPRRARSRWSKINRDKVMRLIEQGAMQPAGLREIERAKADGRWDAAYDSQRTAEIPEDLQRALDENEAAREFFAMLRGQNRYAVLYRIQDAKRPGTRAKRIEQFVAMLAKGKTIYP